VCSDSDNLVPVDCRCAQAGNPCFVANGCVLPDDAPDACTEDAGTELEDAGADQCSPSLTCREVCGDQGKACVENGCNGSTFLFGPEGECARAGEYHGGASGSCDDPLPFLQPYLDREAELGVTCCCEP
jgi:hypothetical protein